MATMALNETAARRCDATAQRRKLALAALALAQFLVIFNGTSANLALPEAGRELGFEGGLSAWFVSSYLLSFGGLLLLAGRLGDALGRKPLLVVALAVFGVGATAAGLAPNGAVLLGGRFVQGIGAAGIGPMVLALLTSTFTIDAERRRALSVWGAVASAGAGFGVLGGGSLTVAFGWRAVLLINAPVALGLLISVALVVIDASPSRQQPLGRVAKSIAERRRGRSLPRMTGRSCRSGKRVRATASRS